MNATQKQVSSSKLASICIGLATLVSCGSGDEWKDAHGRRRDLSLKYETSMLACDSDHSANGAPAHLLFLRSHILDPDLIKPLDEVISPRIGAGTSQYEAKDRAALQRFYDRYRVIATAASDAIKAKDKVAIADAFDEAMALVRKWGRSGIHQLYCKRCDGAIRPAIAELPVSISLGLLSVDDDRESYRTRIADYLRLVDSTDNIHSPNDPDEKAENSFESLMDSLASRNALTPLGFHDGLLLYYVMVGDQGNADKEWKLMTISHISYGNSRFPMADSKKLLVMDLTNSSLSPFDIVKIPRIDSAKFDVCSSLYDNYIEYLVIQSAYDPRYKVDKYVIISKTKQFLKIADIRLFSPPMRRMVDRLLTAETSNVQGAL